MINSVLVFLRRVVMHGSSFILVLATVPLFALYLVYLKLVTSYRKVNGIRRKSAIIYLSPGASVESILNKTGSLEALYTYDGGVEQEFGDRLLMFWYPTKTNLFIETNRGWTFFETIEPPLPFYRLGFFFNLCKMARQASKYDIKFVRAFDPYVAGVSGWLISKIFGVPLCISIHCDYDKMYELDGPNGAPTIMKSRNLAKKLERFMLSRAFRIIAVSDYIAQYAIRNGAPAARVVLFRHATDSSLFQFSPIPEGCAVIAVVSRLSRQKYILDVARIARALKDRGVRFRIEIAGDGETRDDLVSLIRELGVEDEVRLLGFQRREDVAELLTRAGINLCLCGGASLIEASMVGRPSVAYDWEWHGEVVIDGETGRLVPEGDWIGAATAIANLLEKPDQARQMGEAAGRLIRRMYDSEALLEARRTAYRDLVLPASAA